MRTIACVLFAASALAQDIPHHKPVFDYRSSVAKAEALVAEKRFDEALEVSQSAIGQCSPEPVGRECRAHVAFTYGYVFASRGDDEGLRKAAQYYEMVLKEDSENPQAYASLGEVLRRRGESARAANAFAAAAKLSPKDAAAHSLAAAEAMREGKDYASAMKRYLAAIDAGAASAAPRLVSLLRTSGADPRTILGFATELRKRGAMSAAADAYELVIARHADNAALASQALAEWTETRAAAGTLNADALARLPSLEEWPSPFLGGLVGLVRDAKWSFSYANSNLERYAMAAAAKAVADLLVEQGDRRRALQLLDAAVRQAPMLPIEQENIPELSWRPVVYLDVALQMARLATALEDDASFRRIESSLFHEKATAYQKKNAAAIQRMHTVLGTIYTERGEWKQKPDSQFTNATFQLSAALRIAAERQKSEGTIQPLPHLHEWLARAYREQNELQRARSEEIKAARDYLDLDALDRAKASIDRAIATEAPASDDTAVALKKIVEYRTAIPSLSSTTSVQAPNWSATGLDTAFVERQKFKSYADLAGRAQTLGETSKAEELSVRAIDAGANQKLTGTDDALRAIRVQRVIEEKPVEKDKTIGAVDYKKLEVKPETLEVSPEMKEKYSAVSPSLTKAKVKAATQKDQ